MSGAQEDPRLTLLPPHADLIGWAAARLVERHRHELPDLAAVRLLVPSSACAAPLRQRLCAEARGSLLGPQIQTLAQFAAEFGHASPPLSATDCRLILVAALRRYRNLFAGQDPWRLADALFSLFEELSQQAVNPDADEAAFAQRLARAYRARPLSALSFEAQVVHRLWKAFLEDTAGRSPAETYRLNLQQAFAQRRGQEHRYLLGLDRLAAAEHQVIRAELASGHLRGWLQGRLNGRDGAAMRDFCDSLGKVDEAGPASTARSRFLDAVLDEPRQSACGAELQELRITCAEHPEHEARCVDLAIREALLQGSTEVAVVTEDRRLARRLRALLERGGIELHDDAGWALSTSACAAALDCWLEAVETRFHFRPLLSLAKSTFIGADAQALRALERDVILRHEIESGLARIRSRAGDHPALIALLDRFDHAARALPPLSGARSGAVWATALEDSLQRLGLWEAFERDDAGHRLVATLTELKLALLRNPQSVDWTEYRALLSRNIERATFAVPRGSGGGRVRLFTLEQSSLLRADLVILAAATRGRIPAPAGGEPFFNQSVRVELGLPGLVQRQALALAQLRHVLESAPQVRITYAPDEPGEPALLSPWLEAIESAASAQGLDLRDPALALRAGTSAVEIADGSRRLPEPLQQPAPNAPVALLPQKISATVHQNLVDCPYRFFAGALLGLRAEQSPDEDPDRSDYGERVHRILQAFVTPLPDLPPPFGSPVTAANREAAQRHLQSLAEAVFADDLQTRILAHAWLTEFNAGIPDLLDWLAERGPVQVRTEAVLERPLDLRHRLEGRADRLEQLPDGSKVVVDYKTGSRVPRKPEVESGEAVQLVHYALLDDGIGRVEYLSLKDARRNLVIEEGLAGLREEVGARLRQIIEALHRAAPLWAHGDDTVCERCEYRGLCRKGDWTPERPSAEVIALPQRPGSPGSGKR